MTSRPSRAAAVTAGLALALALGLTACSPESVIEDQAGVDVNDDGSVTIEGKDGTASITADKDGTLSIEGEDGTGSITTDDGGITMTGEDGTTITAGASLPDGFPGNVPLLDMEVAYAVSQATDNGTSFSVTMVGAGGRELFDEAAKLLTAAGYSSDDSEVVELGGTVVATGTFTGPHEVALSLLGDDTEATLVYAIDS